ncbi:tellurite resistance/C4-dicarboxylate transporter family protein [Streptomyces sp. NPDC007920]|uniref:tellurite resistance/C4-dicarboxylate transporter family protein n=1 Tax=Streptomyces sp. NPDC007920 TaxID=3364794 RepID=UPI0036E9313C
MPGTSPLRAWLAQRPPAAGAAVMATGIVSVALHLTGYELLSRLILAVACLAWLTLAADFVLRLLGDRARWIREAGTPGALTAVAATTVLGTRFSALGWQTLAEALLALAFVLWPGLLVLVVRSSRRPMPGAVFLSCVATEGLAVLAATLAEEQGVAWPAYAALVLFWIRLALYVFALCCFDLRQLLEGHGDHWIAAGALAISALAGARLVTAGSGRYLWDADDSGVLRTVTLALLVLDLCWYAVLVVAELVRPRPHYDVRRWSTVFPMGMTAAASVSVATAANVPSRGLGEVLLWIAVAAWLAVAAGAVLDARTELRALR